MPQVNINHRKIRAKNGCHYSQRIIFSISISNLGSKYSYGTPKHYPALSTGEVYLTYFKGINGLSVYQISILLIVAPKYAYAKLQELDMCIC